MLVSYLILILPLHLVKCSTTIINASSQNITIPFNGSSQSLNQSTTVKPSNQIEITENRQKLFNIENATNIGIINETKFEKVTSKSFVKLYNKADPRKRKIERKSIVSDVDLVDTEWHCPNISQSKNLEHLCSCDMPHILRCSGDIHTLEVNITLEKQESNPQLIDTFSFRPLLKVLDHHRTLFLCWIVL